RELVDHRSPLVCRLRVGPPEGGVPRRVVPFVRSVRLQPDSSGAEPLRGRVAKRVDDRGNARAKTRCAGRAPRSHAVVDRVDEAEPDVAPESRRIQTDEPPRQPAVRLRGSATARQVFGATHGTATCAYARRRRGATTDPLRRSPLVVPPPGTGGTAPPP